MSGEVSLYELLGVGEGVSEEELRRARRRALKRWHPDRNPERQALATEMTVAIQQAFAQLSDPLRPAANSVPATMAHGGWVRNLDVDAPGWRPPAWSWVGADPVWDLHRHREFFVSQLRALPDDEAVILTTAYRDAAVLLTDRRLAWATGRFRRRTESIAAEDFLRLNVCIGGSDSVVSIPTARGPHRLRLPTVLARAIAEATGARL